MATQHSTVAVGTSATLLVGEGGNGSHQFSKRPRSVTLKPTAAISIGGPGVTVAAGFDIAAGQVVSLQVTEPLYAIGAAATNCKVLVTS
jgi:hypothetical protein